MSKQYSPVRIKNPNTKQSTVRLLSGQSLNLIFDEEQYVDYKLDLKSTFLSVEEIKEIPKGWMATIVQDKIASDENTVFLGEISLYTNTNEPSTSLCVLSKSENNDYLRVVNPNNCTCVLEPNQVLDVVFQTHDLNKRWYANPVAGDLCLEQIQYLIRTPRKNITDLPMVEHFFRFRFNTTSIERLSEQAFGKYNGGQISFVTQKNEISTLKITCPWKGKPSLYKALLLPRIPSCDMFLSHRKNKKQFLQSDVVFRKIENSDLEYGCNVLLAKGIKGIT